MTRTRFVSALVAAAALAGCNKEDQTIVSGPADPMANELANAAPVKLPPAIVASHKYRCKDNSVISIDWLSDGTENSARVTPQGGSTVTLMQAAATTDAGADAGNQASAEAAADGAYTADGAKLSGDPKAASVTYNGQSCKR